MHRRRSAALTKFDKAMMLRNAGMSLKRMGSMAQEFYCDIGEKLEALGVSSIQNRDCIEKAC
jgi:hypothetical protein